MHSPYQLLLLHTQVHTPLTGVILSLCPPEHGQGDIPSFCTYEEGVSGLTAEGQATLQRLEGMLAQSVANTFHMAGVRTDEANGEFDGGSHTYRTRIGHTNTQTQDTRVGHTLKQYFFLNPWLTFQHDNINNT